MRWSLMFFFFSCLGSAFGITLCDGDPKASSACNGWRSLQQLRTLIPERMWQEEFSVKVDKKAFQKAFEKWKKKKPVKSTCVRFSPSKDFYVRSTFSGENIRMLDRYQEFLATPFWDYPDAMQKLKELESKGN